MHEAVLREMIAQGESRTVEFKIKAPRPAELAERLCGMANARGGGVIIFGVADEGGAIIGLAKPSATIDILVRAIRTVKPPILLRSGEPEVRVLDGQTIVVADVVPNDGTLYQSSGVFWIRKGTQTVPMTREEVGSHLNASGAARWETLVCPQATLDDLDQALVDRYVALRTERSRSNLRHTARDELLIGLGCAGVDQRGAVRPTHVGMLLFGVDPQWHLSQSEIVCVRYADDIGLRKFADKQILTGTVLDLIDSAADFLARAMQTSAEIIGFRRVERPDYPLEALREAVVNTVAHRDYSLAGEAIRIFVYTDRVEVHSPGLLPSGITLDDLVTLRARSRPRNPLLVQFLRDVPNSMERMGAGIRLMVNEMRLMGLPDPAFVEHQEFLVTFRNGRAATSSGESPLNARQLLGLRLIQQRGSITSRDYVEATSVSDSTALRELKDMVARGVIVVRGRTRSARYLLP